MWRTDGPLDDMIFELSANLTANGERLIVVDATGYFDPSRVSRAARHPSPRSVHVVRTTPGAELHAAYGQHFNPPNNARRRGRFCWSASSIISMTAEFSPATPREHSGGSSWSSRPSRARDWK